MTRQLQGRRPAPPYSVAVNAAELRHQIPLHGLTAVEVARRPRASGHKVAEATISHALNGWRIHPAKLRAIAAVLQEVNLGALIGPCDVSPTTSGTRRFPITSEISRIPAHVPEYFGHMAACRALVKDGHF